MTPWPRTTKCQIDEHRRTVLQKTMHPDSPALSHSCDSRPPIFKRSSVSISKHLAVYASSSQLLLNTCNPRRVHPFARIIISVTPCRRLLLPLARRTRSKQGRSAVGVSQQDASGHRRIKNRTPTLSVVCGSLLALTDHKRSCNTVQHTFENERTVSRCQRCLRI